MNCSNCGKEIDDNAKFCQFCGTKLQSEQKSHNKLDSIAVIITAIISIFTLTCFYIAFKPKPEMQYSEKEININKFLVDNLISQGIIIELNEKCRFLNSFCYYEIIIDENEWQDLSYLGRKNVNRVSQEYAQMHGNGKNAILKGQVTGKTAADKKGIKLHNF